MKKIVLLFCAFTCLLACKNSVTINNTLDKIFIKDSIKATFALYNYANESIIVYNNMPAFKDSIYSSKDFNYFISSLILIEQGVVFDEKKNYSFANTKLNLANAFAKKDSVFFSTMLSKVSKQRVSNILQNNHLTPSKLIYDSTISNFENMNNIVLSLDEMLGFVSKFYFKKSKFQARTFDIIKNIFITKVTDNTMCYFNFSIKDGNRSGITGWVEKSNRPYFFILLLSQNNLQNITDVKNIAILNEVLNMVGN